MSASAPPPDDDPTVSGATNDLSSGTQADAPQTADAAGNLEESGVREEDHTIVSAGNVVAPDDAYSGLRPRDLGKALVGQKIGSVQLEEFVGGGGMGAVFRGRDLALQRTVAVKVLATHNLAAGDTARRFEIEAQSAARLDHPNIARTYQAGEGHGLQYIVFEFIEGSNLRDIVAERGPQPVRDVLSYSIQLADALVHAWRRQVVHRDIKPSNILVTTQGQAKLVDMGLARMHQAEQPEQDLTATGATLGTFDYIAPEQARDPRSADIRSDIYSLGCTLFFLLTGKPPFPDGTALQKLLRHQGDQPPDLRAERPDAPRALARVIEKMLAKRPESRQQDPAVLLRELLSVAQPLGVAPMSTAVLASAQTGRGGGSAFFRRHAPWLCPTLLLLLVGAVLPGLWSPASAPRKFEALQLRPPAAPPENDDLPLSADDAELEPRGFPADSISGP